MGIGGKINRPRTVTGGAGTGTGGGGGEGMSRYRDGVLYTGRGSVPVGGAC